MESKENQETDNIPQQAGGGSESETRLAELRAQHRDLDEQISWMESRPSLSPEEQLETATLKKRKLALRDQIELVSSRV